MTDEPHPCKTEGCDALVFNPRQDKCSVCAAQSHQLAARSQERRATKGVARSRKRNKRRRDRYR